MQIDQLLTILQGYQIHDQVDYISGAFARNLGLIDLSEQKKLSEVRVAIAGLGGVGGVHLTTLTRLGVGAFNLADFDKFEIGNVNRQYGARVPDFGRSKIDVMAEEALSINPFLNLRLFPEGVNQENMKEFLEGTTILLDGLDYFEFELRSKLFSLAQDMNIPVVSAGPFGFSSAMLIFKPNGMRYDDYFNFKDGMRIEDKIIHFQVGYTPRLSFLSYLDLSKVDQDNQRGPSCIIATQLASVLVASEVLRIILNRGSIKAVPYYLQFDPYLRRLYRGYMPLGNRNPIQKFKIMIGKRSLKTAHKGKSA